MIRRISLALLPVFTVGILATLGYVIFWGWTPLQAAYMTAITIGTVGFREVRPLTPGGQVFTIAVIVGGVAGATFAIGRIVDIVVEEQLGGRWEGRRMRARIAELSGHTIIAGLGRVGSVVAEELVNQHKSFVVIDTCDDCIQVARERGWLFVDGDATEESTLNAAGVGKAGALVTALNGDAENLFVTVTARALNPEIFIVARSSHATTEAKLLNAGANRVMTPNVIGGRRMATMVLHPTVSDYLDLVSHGSGLEYRLQEVELREGSRLDGVSLMQAKVRSETGAYILAIRHTDGRIDTNPVADTVMHAGDHLVVLGTSQQVEALLDKA